MRTVLAILLSLLTMLALPARGQESRAETGTVGRHEDGTETVPVEAAKAAEKEFVPPDGWRPKKRGEFTVYCRKDYNVKGTRFPAEICYDEAGIRAMLAAQREDRERWTRCAGSAASDGVLRPH